MRVAFRLGIELLAGIAVGCSGTTDVPSGGATDGSTNGSSFSDGAPSTTPRSYDDYTRSYALALCDALFHCDPHDDWTAPALFGTEQRCAQYYQGKSSISGSGGASRDLSSKLASGALTFQPAEAERCLAVLGGCTSISGDALAGCLEVLEGQVAPGGPCDRDEDCRGDAYCGSAAGVCPGSCRLRSKENDVCLASYACSPGDGAARCVLQPNPVMPGLATGTCRSYALRQGAAAGAPCGNVGSDQVACARGLYCDGTQHCAEPVAAGGACRPGLRCGPGEQCIGSTCVAIVVQRSAGAACDSQGATCSPLDNLVCRSGTCQTVAGGATGSPCIPEGDTCAPGLWCDGAASAPVCAQPGSTGAACTANAGCQSGSCGPDRRCTASYCSVELAR